MELSDLNKKNKWNIDFSDYLVYSDESPSKLKWKIDRYGGVGYRSLIIKVGTNAGTRDKNKNYWHVCINLKSYPCHRVVWELFNGVLPDGQEIDHINGDSSDNSISNLRSISKHLNIRNRKRPKNNSSGITGVHLHISTGRGGKKYRNWEAEWRSLDGIRCRKGFSVHKHGEEEAFRLACEYRAKMIEELNSQGAGYTERHGQ